MSFAVSRNSAAELPRQLGHWGLGHQEASYQSHCKTARDNLIALQSGLPRHRDVLLPKQLLSCTPQAVHLPGTTNHSDDMKILDIPSVKKT